MDEELNNYQIMTPASPALYDSPGLEAYVHVAVLGNTPLYVNVTVYYMPGTTAREPTATATGWVWAAGTGCPSK